MFFALGGGQFIGLVVGLIVVVMGAVDAGRQVIADAPPARFAHEGPDAALVASRSSRLGGGLVFGLFFALDGGPLVGLASGWASSWASVWFGGLVSGLDAWLYHHWLRWRLSARGVLPTQLPAFLEWCASSAPPWFASDSQPQIRGLIVYAARCSSWL